jgi:hypothetical protein
MKLVYIVYGSACTKPGHWAVNEYLCQGFAIFIFLHFFYWFWNCCQGRIQDFQLGEGGALKKNAPSGGRCENFWGVSCEKSRFYTNKSYFFQLQRPPPWIRPWYRRRPPRIVNRTVPKIIAISVHTVNRFPLRLRKGVYNLIEVISSWTEQKLRSILN